MPHDHHDHHDHSHHDHGHTHSHGHGHSHAPTNFGPRFLIAATLNTVFIVAEILYGLKANSLALLADAGHNFSDVIGLLLAWGAWWLARKKPVANFTYGFRGASIVAALINAILLLVAVGGIAFEAVQRLTSETPADGITVMAVAGLGIVINGVTAWLFASDSGDLNIKATFAHLAADAGISAAVVVSGFLMLLTHWLWLDPVLSLAVSAFIVWGTWGLLRDSVRLSLQGVPGHIDYAKVKAELAALPGVTDVHDLHIWGMSTTEVALTAHLTMPDGHPGDAFLHDLTHSLKDHHSIGHVTVQIEIGGAPHACSLAPDDVV